MSPKKLRKIEAVKSWINAVSAYDGYCAEIMQPYNGDELDRMTIKQIDMLLDHIKAVHHMAYQSGAKLVREMKAGAA